MLDGASRVDELVARAVADRQPALGITDHGNMYGTLEFYKECRRQGIKPIIGTEAYMAHDHRSERPTRRGRVDDSGGDTEGGQKLYYHLTLLAENGTGYRNLIQLASRAYLEGYYYKPRLDWELLAEHHEGLIATTGCLGGHVLQSLLRGDRTGALEKAARLQDIFGRDHLFVELQDHGLPAQRDTNPQLLEIARELQAPVLATNDSHYTHREDHDAHDALLCVQTGAVLSDPKRFKIEGQEHYLKTADEMRYLFRDVPEACDNTLWVAERADVEITFGDMQLPTFPLPDGYRDDAAYLAELTWQGARERWGDELAGPVKQRIQYELDTIAAMGFSSYFLIVWDLIAYARRRGIRVGPGRGSAAGCAVAYCLRITDLDPIHYDLLFERFLNPSRLSMPDIDMDFDSRYRDEMIRYAAERYGRDHVAQIITFGTIKARNAVRDAARVLGFPYAVGDRIAKAMPPLVMGRDTSLKYCFEQDPKHTDGYHAAAELRAMYDADPDVKKVVDVAKGLEGLKRSDGIHAAAVVITKEPLTTYLPVQRKPESGQDPADAPVVTQIEMHGVEELGLLKMDFLGLRNLDVITDTVEMLRGRSGARLRHRHHRPRRPAHARAAPARRGHRHLPARGRADAQPDAVAPSDQLRRRRRPRRPVPARPDGGEHAQRLRRPQERPQVDHLPPPRPRGAARRHLRADDLPGVGDAGRPEDRRLLPGRRGQPPEGLREEDPRADRRASGRSSSTDASAPGTAASSARALFDIIEPFADYAFNKSHAYGYGLVAYQTAYLKAHHPVEYLACLLTSVKSSLEKAAVYIAECRALGIRVLPPDINRSVTDFAALAPSEVPDGVTLPVGSPGAITFGLSAVRNVGGGLVALLLAERDEHGPFTSFHDFVERVPEPVLNKRAVESLIKAGAFDSLGHPRKGLLGVFEHVTETTVTRRRERDQGVMSLFGDWEGAGDGEAVLAPCTTSAYQCPRSSSTRPTSSGSRRRCSGCTCPTTRCSASRPRCAARSSTPSPTWSSSRTARWCRSAGSSLGWPASSPAGAIRWPCSSSRTSARRSR